MMQARRVGRLSWTAAVTALTLIGVTFPTEAWAQDRETLVIACADGASPEVTPYCLEGVLALEAIRAGVSTAVSQGSDIPGFSSTVGVGEGGMPRLSTSLRFGLTRVKLPVILASQRIPAESGTLTVSTVSGVVALGVFNGFAGPGSTRGVLSFDLLGQAAITLLPSEDGFNTKQMVYGYGARLGILREGFSNPGVSLSLVRRFFNEPVGYGSFVEDVQITTDPDITSMRLTVGRDFFRAGFNVGAGYDWIGGDVALRVDDREGGSGSGRTSSEDFTSERISLFAGGQYTWRVFQTSAELGWARGFDGAEGYLGDFDPASATLFGTLAVRLTF